MWVVIHPDDMRAGRNSCERPIETARVPGIWVKERAVTDEFRIEIDLTGNPEVTVDDGPD